MNKQNLCWRVWLVALLEFIHTIGHPSSAINQWGQIRTQTIVLEAPTHELEQYQLPPAKLGWFLGRKEFTNFLDRLKEFDLTPSQRACLEDKKRWDASMDGHWFWPERQMVLELSPQGREQIYSWLGRHSENPNHKHPFILHSNDIDECLAHSTLDRDRLAILRRLLYKRGSCWCFSDIALFDDLRPEELLRLLKTVARFSTLIAQLRVTPESDLSGLLGYWSSSTKNSATKPLFESLVRVPGGISIDIAHVLPPFARSRLYRFPNIQRDCFWSALNFFNEKPDDRLADASFVRDVLKRDYFLTWETPRFGDLITLADAAGQISHCSVYIAEDVVFTKNGADLISPWILMKIPDMVRFYAPIGLTQEVTLRRYADVSAVRTGK